MKALITILAAVIMVGCSDEKIYYVGYHVTGNRYEYIGSMIKTGDLVRDSIKAIIVRDYMCTYKDATTTSDVVITGIYRFENREEYETYQDDNQLRNVCEPFK